MLKVLQATALHDKTAAAIIDEQKLPYSSTYKKIAELVKWGLLVSYKSELIDGKRVAYYKSTFHSLQINYNGSLKTTIEAKPNADALERISMRFYDL
jgi:hypothetical protein